MADPLDALLGTNPLAAEFGYGPKIDPAKFGRPVKAPPFNPAKLGRPVGLDLSQFGKPVTEKPLGPVLGAVDTLGQGIGEAGKGLASGALSTSGSVLKGASTFSVIDPEIAQQGADLGLYPINPNRPIEEQISTGRPQDTPLFKGGEAMQDFAADRLGPGPGWEDSWTRSISQAFGSTAPFLVAGLAGPASLPIGTIAGVWAGAGEAMDRAIESGATQEQIMQAARLGNIPGATEQLPIEVLFERVPLPAMGRFAGVLGRVFTKAAAEGGQEGLQQAAQNLIERYVYNPEQDIAEGVTEAAGLGAIVGGGIGAATEPLRRQAAPPVAAAQPQPTPQEAPQAAPPLTGDILPPEAQPAPAPSQGDLQRPILDLQANVPPAQAASQGAAPTPSAALGLPPAEPPSAVAAGGGQLQRLSPPIVTPEPEIVTDSPPLAVPVGQPVDLASRGRPVRGAGTRQSPALLAAPQDVARAEAQAVEATPAQAAAGNAKAGHARFRGLQITVQVPKGGTRKGIAADGTPWTAPDLSAIYGHLRGVKAKDGQPMDVFVGPDLNAETVFILDQVTPEGAYDESKTLLGFRNEQEARTAYESAFSDGRARERVGAISAVPFAEFKTWARSGKTRRAFNSKAVAEVRRRRKALQPTASPERGMWKYPILQTLKRQGGVDPASTLAGELRSMGVSQKTLPGLFRKGGRGALDNLVSSDFPEFQGVDDGSGYVPEDAFLDAIHSEMFGSPVRSPGQEQEIAEFEAAQTGLSTEDEVALDALLQELGMAEDAEVRSRARELMAEGADVDSAVDRAIMRAAEEDVSDERPARIEDAPVPGFAEPDRSDEGATALAPARKGRDQSGAQGDLLKEQATVPGARQAERTPDRVDLSSRGRPVEIGADGKPQLLIPGAEKASDATLAQRKADAPLKPKAEQKSVDGLKLFGDDAKQTTFLKPSTRARRPGLSRSDIEKEIFAIVDRMSAGKRIRLERKVRVTDKAALRASGHGDVNEAEISGSYNYVTGLIRVAMATADDPRSTAIHESWHSLEVLLTEEEQALLDRERPRLYFVAADFLGYPRHELAELSDREIVATAAEAYIFNNKVRGIHVAVRRIFDRLARIIREVRNWLEGHSYKTAEDVFDKAWAGEIKARGARPSRKGESLSPARRKAPTFYSAVVRAVENARLTKASPDQWLGTLRNTQGVKEEELSWLGVEEWLHGQGSVTKEALADFVRANQVEVKEVVRATDTVTEIEKKLDDLHTRMVAETIEEEGGGDPETTVPSLEVTTRHRDEWEELVQAKHDAQEMPGDVGTKFASYQLPGGENYRELLLTLPEDTSREARINAANARLEEIQSEFDQLHSEPDSADLAGRRQALANEKTKIINDLFKLHNTESSNFRSGHWDEPNVLAHIRFNERTADGKCTLFIEEIQSDWHQQGRKRGYGGPTGPQGWGDTAGGTAGGVPDAPFKTTWPELALKRMIRWAAENGFEQVAWTPGDVQAERYDLSKHIRALNYEPTDDGKYELEAIGTTGETVIHEDDISLARVEELVGKDIAKKIEDREGEHTGGAYREWRTLRGLDLKVGGEGMRGFYDKMLPNVANKLGKKFGARVTEGRIKADNAPESVVEEWAQRDPDHPFVKKNRMQVWTIPITDAMRDAAIGEGFTAFAPPRRRRADPNAAFDVPNTPARVRKFLTSVSFNRFGASFPTERDLRFNLQDRMIDMRETQKAIADQLGGPLPGEYDVYQAEELYHGKTGARLFKLRREHIRPLTAAMRSRKVSGHELGQFHMARHAPERNADLRARGSTLAAPSGMSNREAAQIIARLTRGGRRADFDYLARMVDGIIADTRDTLLGSGLISAEQHADWSTRYRHYVPLRGFENDPESEQEMARIGRGFDVRGPEAKQATGRSSRAENPLIYAIMQAEQAIVRAEKNRVLNTLRRLVETFPNKAIWEVNRIEQKTRINKDTGMLETYSVGPANFFSDNVFVAKREGVSTFITIHDPKLARDMKMLGADGLRSFLRFTAWINRTLSKLHTSLNPTFTIPNFFRDAMTGLLHLSEYTARAPGLRRKVMRDIPRAMGAMGRYLAGKDAGKWTGYAKEFAEAGGKIEFFNIDSVGEQQRKIEADLKSGKVRNAFRMLLDAIEIGNGAVENAIRLATYVNLRRAQFTKAEAASAARNLTVNFNRKGAWGPSINSLYLFYNAAFQGNVRLGGAMKRSKVVRRAVVAMILSGAAQDMLNYFLSGDDDDGMNRWDKLPAWEKERNYSIWLPGQDGAIKIPIGYGYSVAPVIGNQVSAMVRKMIGMGKGVEPLEAALNIASALFGSFMPISAGSTISQTISPTVSDPFVEIIQNQDWSGRRVHPTNFDPQNDPDSTLAFRSTSPFAKKLAQALNSLSGGNEFKPGALDYSPNDIDHLVEFFIGGAGDFWYDKIGTNLWRLATGEEIESYQVPFRSKVYTEVGTFTDQNVYYDLQERVESVKVQRKGFNESGQADRAKKVMRDNPVEAAVIGVFDASEKKLRALRKQQRAMEARGLPREKELAERNRIRGEMDKVMLEARKAWEKARREKAN